MAPETSARIAGLGNLLVALWLIRYDIVLSMIMAHAPMVIPALTGLSFPFTPALWIPLILLQITVAMRVIGDILELWDLRRWGAMLNALTLALFVAMVIGSVVRGQLPRRHGTAAAV